MPFPGRESPIDAVDDFFRVRLACTLLDTCGVCFPKGSQGRKLEQYLIMLQVSPKMQPLSTFEKQRYWRMD